MDETPALTRRALLATGGAVGVGALAGCTGASSRSAVTVLAAGSLSVVFNETVGPAFETAADQGYRGEFHGSNAVMRMTRDGQKHPDVIVSADPPLLRDKLQGGPDPITDWDVVFASNEVGITYAPETDVGDRLAAGEPWYAVLRKADAEIARSDPNLDPLGYRTLMLFELAETYYDEPGLREALASNLRIDPSESHMLAAVETGDRAAAVTYRNMAVDHGLEFLALPDELNFSNPAYEDHYASVTYTTDEGHTVEGTPVLYNATVPADADNPEAGRRFLRFLLGEPDLLTENGLVVTDAFPRPHGNVPPEVLP
ncbi:MAG: extracellular solute-binding protein [Halanaeroarchaeum sp.]